MTVDGRRAGLRSFLGRHDITLNRLAKASDVSEGALRHFLVGRNNSLSGRTYARLAAGATKLTGRTVCREELQEGLPPAPFSPAERSHLRNLVRQIASQTDPAWGQRLARDEVERLEARR